MTHKVVGCFHYKEGAFNEGAAVVLKLESFIDEKIVSVGNICETLEVREYWESGPRIVLWDNQQPAR